MIDALGFKGIWETCSSSELLDKLHEVRNMAEDHVKDGYSKLAVSLTGPGKLATPPEPFVRFLSDTVIAGLVVDSAELLRLSDVKRTQIEGALITLCGITVAYLVYVSAISEPPLNYRGALAYGEFQVENNFLLGPAVDRAAELMDSPDAAVVILDPESAASRQRECIVQPTTARPLFLDVPVPVKRRCSSTQEENHRILNPMAVWSSAEEEQNALDGMKRAFRRSPLGASKERNTLALVSLARSATSGGV